MVFCKNCSAHVYRTTQNPPDFFHCQKCLKSWYVDVKEKEKAKEIYSEYLPLRKELNDLFNSTGVRGAYHVIDAGKLTQLRELAKGLVLFTDCLDIGLGEWLEIEQDSSVNLTKLHQTS